MDRLRILLADDDSLFCRLAGELLSQNGYNVTVALDPASARKSLHQDVFDILMLDLGFPDLQDGFDILEEAHMNYPQLAIMMISGVGNIPDVVRAIKNGAADFIEKPLEPEFILLRLKGLGERIQREKQVTQLEHTAIGMVAVSEEMEFVFSGISAAAKFDSPVLITGETGVGKELAARAVHRLSKLGGKEMVSINCASVPKDLFEAELFGYEKGSFTGATFSYKGYFGFAQKTSLFLDEISELPFPVQAKLLRALSEGEIQRIGGEPSISQTRIISASNQDLQAAIKEGRFREDLFYRLNSIHIHIPPLRQRQDDILPLALHFLNEFCQRNQLLPKDISDNAQAWLIEQDWEGNARELKSCVERAMIFSEHTTLEVEDFITLPPESEISSESAGTLRESLKQCEIKLIKQKLAQNNHNITQTAKHLGVDKSNLSKRIHALGINPHH